VVVLKNKTFLLYFFLVLLAWVISIVFPVAMPVLGVVYLISGILTRKNTALSEFSILSIANGILLISLAMAIYVYLYSFTAK
jgi:uncharacterized membrane protein